MAEITTPVPLKLEELRGKAEELCRSSHEFSSPRPVIIPAPRGEVDPEAVDRIASQAFSELYDSDKYSDLVIKCQDRLWRAHKAVVCPQSKVLAACVDGPFREAQTGEIDLSEDEPEIVAHMIEYLYKGFYDFETPVSAISFTPDPVPSKPDWISRIWQKPPVPAANINPLAAFPDIMPRYQGHQHHANFQSTSSVQSAEVNGRVAPTPSRLITHASVYCLAEQYDIPRLKNYALCKYAILAPLVWKSPFFIPSLRLIYDRTPSRLPLIDDLRAIAAKTAADNSIYFLDNVEFLECCTENSEISMDVMRMVLISKQREHLVDWKVKVECKVDKGHELVYVPFLVGFGGGYAGGGLGTRAMVGFGRSDRGVYKCLRCGTNVK